VGSSPWRYEEAPTALGIADELARKDALIRDKNRLVSELEAQLGTQRVWSTTPGFGAEQGNASSPGGGDGGEDKGGGGGGGADGAASAEVVHVREQAAAGAATATMRSDGTLVHAVTLSSDSGKRGKERLLAFIGVNTGFASRARRDVLRSTWFPSGAALRTMEVEHGLLFRFVIGNTKLAGDSLDMSLQDEMSEHDDFFRLKHTDTYDRQDPCLPRGIIKLEHRVGNVVDEAGP